jgi:membrane-associated phospholipid phosphatase
MPTPGEQRDPTVARASPRGWRLRAWDLTTAGYRQVRALGLTLLLGFAAAVIALHAFAELADEVMERETLRLDQAVLGWLRQFASPGLDAFALTISVLGSELVWVIVVTVLVALWRRGRWGATIALLLVTGGASALNTILKGAFQRARPELMPDALGPFQEFAFPSGHAMVAAAFYGFVAYLSWRLLRGWKRVLWTGGLLVLVALIGWSRLYLGVHYLTDVLAGYLAGFLWVEAVIIAGSLLSRRRARSVARRSEQIPR